MAEARTLGGSGLPVDIVLYDLAELCMVWYGMVLYGIVRYSTVLYGIEWYCMVLYGIVWSKPKYWLVAGSQWAPSRTLSNNFQEQIYKK